MTKLVIRVLGDYDAFLGWTEHSAAIKGDGCLRASSPVTVVFVAEGRARQLSIHWCDVNVESRIPIPELAVVPGQAHTFFAANDPIIKVGDMPGRLEPVTVGSQSVGVPVGQMGSRGAA